MKRVRKKVSWKPPCTYQGGKQRLSGEIIDIMQKQLVGFDDVHFFDLCCGSGAVSIDLLNRGLSPTSITMVDVSSWGLFWKMIGNGSFDLKHFKELLCNIPSDKSLVCEYARSLSMNDACVDEVYVFLILQSMSFGGKQVWRDGHRWQHSGFRSYWQPKPDSVRQSVCNPMQPCSHELYNRVELLVEGCGGIVGVQSDVSEFVKGLNLDLSVRNVAYVDPPYEGTTGYCCFFDVSSVVDVLLSKGFECVFVSEGKPLCENSVRLKFGGPKGGISGKKIKGEEWVSIFK